MVTPVWYSQPDKSPQREVSTHAHLHFKKQSGTAKECYSVVALHMQLLIAASDTTATHVHVLLASPPASPLPLCSSCGCRSAPLPILRAHITPCQEHLQRATPKLRIRSNIIQLCAKPRETALRCVCSASREAGPRADAGPKLKQNQAIILGRNRSVWKRHAVLRQIIVTLPFGAVPVPVPARFTGSLSCLGRGAASERTKLLPLKGKFLQLFQDFR